jgi:hypothetical protein
MPCNPPIHCRKGFFDYSGGFLNPPEWRVSVECLLAGDGAAVLGGDNQLRHMTRRREQFLKLLYRSLNRVLSSYIACTTRRNELRLTRARGNFFVQHGFSSARLPLTNKGRMSVKAAFTASFKSWVARFVVEPLNLLVFDINESGWNSAEYSQRGAIRVN